MDHSKEYMPQPRVEELGLTMLRKSHVIVSGVAGRGKTALAKQLMVRLCEEEKYLPVKIHDPSEWKNCISCREKCVVFIDDFIGRSNLSKSELDSWEKLFDEMISYAKSGKIRIIFGIRRTILQEAGNMLKRHKLFASQYHLDLSQERNDLTHEEKSALLKHFCQAFDVLIHDKGVFPMTEQNKTSIGKLKMVTKNTLDAIAETKPLMGFPQACYVFFSDDSMFRLGVDYFVHADQELKDEVRRLRRKEPLRYLLLAYALLENRKINTTQLNHKKLKTLCKTFRQIYPQDADVEDELDEMKLSYMKYTEGTYEFRHETYVEAVLCSFSDSYAKVFLANARDEIIKEFVRSSGYQPNPGEICVCLSQDLTQDLAARVLDLKDVFPTSIFSQGFVISELQTVNDPVFAKEIISIIKSRTPHKPNISYFAKCLKIACRHNRHSFVEEVLCNFDIVEGDSIGFQCDLSEGMVTEWIHPDYRPKPLKKVVLPTSTYYITNGDIEQCLALALQHGCIPVLDTILRCARYNLNKEFGHQAIGSILHSKMKGMTPVIFASYARCKPSVEYLIRQKVNLRKTDSYGCNALHYCIAAGWVDIVERMLSIQRKLIRQESYSGMKPLCVCLAVGNEAMYDKLTEMLDLANVEDDFLKCENCIKEIFSGITHCHDMYDYHFCAFWFPIYIRNYKLSEEEDFLSLLRRLPAEKLSSNMRETSLDQFENKLPHFCVINRLSTISNYQTLVP